MSPAPPRWPTCGEYSDRTITSFEYLTIVIFDLANSHQSAKTLQLLQRWRLELQIDSMILRRITTEETAV